MRHTGRLRGCAALAAIFALGMLGVLPATNPAAARVDPRSATRSLETFVSDGWRVRIEVVRGLDEDRAPAVIILHGASGVTRGSMLYQQADALAERGVSSFIVHYFDGLGSVPAKSRPTLHALRDRVIRGAIDYVRTMPFVDVDRVGVYGLSLGGFHALDLASRDGRIAAVAGVVGAMPGPTVRAGVTYMPPTLIVHGDRDEVVPVRRAYELARMLDRLGASYELKIYRGQPHTFRGAAREDSIQRIADFFALHLRPTSPGSQTPGPSGESPGQELSEWPPA